MLSDEWIERWARRIVHFFRRLFCILLDRHEWDERTIIRWCTKCLWVEVKHPTEGWTSFARAQTFLIDSYNDDWMTPQDMKTMSDELFEYMELSCAW